LFLFVQQIVGDFTQECFWFRSPAAQRIDTDLILTHNAHFFQSFFRQFKIVLHFIVQRFLGGRLLDTNGLNELILRKYVAEANAALTKTFLDVLDNWTCKSGNCSAGAHRTTTLRPNSTNSDISISCFFSGNDETGAKIDSLLLRMYRPIPSLLTKTTIA
uniref:Uncharacterized protein n=1 Tax=Romanomermis culicivorax TaxID=13658 RepID=A0A915KQ47_ROMCU